MTEITRNNKGYPIYPYKFDVTYKLTSDLSIYLAGPPERFLRNLSTDDLKNFLSSTADIGRCYYIDISEIGLPRFTARRNIGEALSNEERDKWTVKIKPIGRPEIVKDLVSDGDMQSLFNEVIPGVIGGRRRRSRRHRKTQYRKRMALKKRRTTRRH